MKTRIIMVMSLDGVIAKNSNHNPVEWTSKEDQALYKKITTEAGVMIFGQSTYEAIGRQLPGRLNIVLTRDETHQDQPGILEYKRGDLKTILQDLEHRGFEFVIIGGGTFVNSKFLEAGLVDEIQITIEPKIFGSGLRFVDQLNLDLALELISCEKLNDHTINVLYRIKK